MVVPRGSESGATRSRHRHTVDADGGAAEIVDVAAKEEIAEGSENCYLSL